MAKYRTIKISFWDDPYIEGLQSDAKLLYIYLFTCPQTNNLGILEITHKKLSSGTGIPIKKIREIMACFEKDGKVVIDEYFILVVNFIKNQATLAGNMLAGLKSLLSETESEKIKRELVTKYPDLFEGLEAPIKTLEAPLRPSKATVKYEVELKDEFEVEVEVENEVEAKGEERKGIKDIRRPECDEYVCPQEKIVELYHEMLPELPKVKIWTDKRKSMLRSRWKEDKARQNVEWWEEYFGIVKASDFLMGKSPPSKDRRPFLATLEWLINPANMVKVLEGYYANREAKDMFQIAAEMGYEEARRRTYSNFSSLRDEPNFADVDSEKGELASG